MKSKVRKIVVDSQSYIWGVTGLDGHTVNIKVWNEGNKTTPWFEVIKKFDDPWINFSQRSKDRTTCDERSTKPVTPKLVASLIKEVKESQEQGIDSKPLYFRITAQGGLKRQDVAL